jgi:hypothetical protein
MLNFISLSATPPRPVDWSQVHDLGEPVGISVTDLIGSIWTLVIIAQSIEATVFIHWVKPGITGAACAQVCVCRLAQRALEQLGFPRAMLVLAPLTCPWQSPLFSSWSAIERCVWLCASLFTGVSGKLLQLLPFNKHWISVTIDSRQRICRLCRFCRFVSGNAVYFLDLCCSTEYH